MSRRGNGGLNGSFNREVVGPRRVQPVRRTRSATLGVEQLESRELLAANPALALGAESGRPPVVSAAQNGPGVATTLTTVFDPFGRPIWQKDGDGFLTYIAYDQATGAVVKQIRDVDTTQTSTFANLPGGWTTPAGGGLHLTTTSEVDSLGRVIKTTHPNGRVDYATYNDALKEVRLYAGWDAAGGTPTGTTQVVRADWANGYVETLTMSAAPVVSGGRPTGTEAVSGLQTLSRTSTNAGSQVVTSDAYFNLAGLTYTTATNLGTANTHFYRTQFGYDGAGRGDRTLAPSGTIYRTVSDALGRIVSQWVGLDDTPTSGSWSPTNTAGSDLVKLSENEFDNGAIGDGNLTKQTQFPGLGAAPRVTQTWHDWRNRPVVGKAGVEATESAAVNRPLSYVEYDNLGQALVSEVYDGDAVSVVDANADGVPDRPSASLLRGNSTASFDDLGRVFRIQVFSVDPVSGTVSSSALVGNTWYDQRGQVVKTSPPGGAVTKSRYDGVGRVSKNYSTDGGGDTSWGDALGVTGDIVLSQAEYAYDANGNVLQTTVRQRFHDAAGTGELGTPSSGVTARVSYAASYYDKADRLIASVDVGTHGGTAWARPGTVPAGSDTILVTGYAYNAAGWVEATTDPKGIVGKAFHDNLGRTTRTIANYVDGVVGNDNDITTEYAYNSVGRTSLTSRRADGTGQTTQWVHGVSLAAGSGLNSNDLVGQTRWPDATTGAASASEQETVLVNALGQPLVTTDRNGSTHTLTYDILGRLVSDAVTTLGAGVDGSVRRVETAYDSQGNAYLITSYDAATGGNIVNQVQREFNGLGQLTSEWQEHGGVVTGSSLRVRYAYTALAGGANHSRLTSITYPNGKVLNFNYAAGLDDAISRLSSLSDASGTLESYDYLGDTGVVSRKHPQPGVDLSYIKRSGEANGDAGDPYTGLDRFGRIVDQRWLKSSDGFALDRLQHTYDRNGNRLSRTNLIDAGFSENYSYDNLNQLSGFTRGTHNRSWNYDAQGNWQSVTTNGSTQTRTHNAQNEITGISGGTTPTYDANGNLTRDETGQQFVYDAWNRLVAVKDAGGTTLKSYAYDAQHRRIRETAGGTTTDLYYSDSWQVLEERVAIGGTSVPRAQYIWSPVYVDALVLRDRDTNGDGTLDERRWVVQDANYNVTALLDNAGTVVERYVYDPFGQATVIDANWNALAASAFAWVYLHQGGRLDATSGLYHFRHRDYSPTLGRWTSIDPLRYAAGDVNLYRTVFNAPTIYTDPSGQLFWIPIIIAVVIIAGASGGATGYVTGEGPSTAGSFIPGWGAGRSAGAHYSRGNYWRGTGYTALAVSDVFLVRSVATNFARVGLRGSAPGTMSIYLEREPTHFFWSVSGRQPYPYYQALTNQQSGQLLVRGTEMAGLGGEATRVFWSPVLNTGMAGIGRHGYPATNCFTSCVSAWSAGNYHLVPYVGLHGPATIGLPEQHNNNAAQALGPLFPPNPNPFAFNPRPNPLLFLPPRDDPPPMDW